MVANCGIDERGLTSGGVAGDQGGEYEVKAWYPFKYGWYCVLRWPNIGVGQIIAQVAKAAALNDNIGYDQLERYTFYNELKSAKWNPSNIRTPCETDCSASSITCCIAAGYLCKIPALQRLDPGGYTGSMRSDFTSAGFQCLTSSQYTDSPDYLLPGDVLLNDDHHTCINLDAGSLSGSNISVSNNQNLLTAFKARKTEPDLDDVNYICVGSKNSKKKAGKNKCIDAGARYEHSGYALPNCTGYAWGRFMEILGETPKLCTGNANKWYTFRKDGYERGQEPKVGAVACWSKQGDAGHVAIVEEISKDGKTITCSASGYSNPWEDRWFLQQGTKKQGYWEGSVKAGYKFQGFIYNPKASDFSDLAAIAANLATGAVGGGVTGNGTGGLLYAIMNDADDAVMLEMSYSDAKGVPTLKKTEIKMCVINYTTALNSFLATIMAGSGGTASGDLSGLDSASNYTGKVYTGSKWKVTGITNSVARQCAEFLLDKGLNAAGAAAVLGNLVSESGFDTGAVGDNGTSFGIGQWHNERGTAMKQVAGSDWANNLTGQLMYMWSELESSYYRHVLTYLQNVPNTEQGAYDGGYYWCVHFEVPDDRFNRGVVRGNQAMEYFRKMTVTQVTPSLSTTPGTKKKTSDINGTKKNSGKKAQSK